MSERTPEEEARLDLIHETAEKAYGALIQEHPEWNVKEGPKAKKGEEQAHEPKGWHDLTTLERLGIHSHVAAVLADPMHQGYPQIMRNNKDRKEYRALDDAIRDQLGYARVAR